MCSVARLGEIQSSREKVVPRRCMKSTKLPLDGDKERNEEEVVPRENGGEKEREKRKKRKRKT